VRLAILKCAHCGDTEKKLYLHHGKLFCAGCLTYGPGEEMAVKVRIVCLRAEETREESKRLKER